ncbi:hypothetical protein PN462_10510 [Spirulina sp. CS-785/01]|uniref:hypothetical protein n=1 Tax=Spirulina sp. CS-785/01 TaxID=3021716 RepID=UPI00232AD31B|nr:hypothetical protein [Spirulina sp. CS-785/01]MDB9313531.1 hypothetical protein [Spirulina sp. CS-785/01]
MMESGDAFSQARRGYANGFATPDGTLTRTGQGGDREDGGDGGEPTVPYSLFPIPYSLFPVPLIHKQQKTNNKQQYVCQNKRYPNVVSIDP